MIYVTGIGLRWGEGATTTIDRPFGLGQFLLLRFYGPMEVVTAQGLQLAEAGQCVLYSPATPQWYRSRQGDWLNDWLHLEGEAVYIVAQQHQVPLNTLLEPGDTGFLPSIFSAIGREQQQAELDWEVAVDLLVRQLLLQLGRAVRSPSSGQDQVGTEHLAAMRSLRWSIHDQLRRRWTVDEMAAQVGLSRSRFATLYVKYFGVSPMEDLLRARLRFAQTLLTNRALSVSEAAAQSGFNSVHYFSHVFHERVGCAPRDYFRRRDING